MRLVKEIEINENGQLFLGPEELEKLELIESKVRCILDKGRITLLSTKRIVDELSGCLGEEKVSEYQFDIELERFSGDINEGI